LNREQWHSIQERLRAEVGEAAFRSWLQPVNVHYVNGTRIDLAVPTRFMRNWIETHYGDRIRNLIKTQNPTLHTIELVVADPLPFASSGEIVSATSGMDDAEAGPRSSGGAPAGFAMTAAMPTAMTAAPTLPARAPAVAAAAHPAADSLTDLLSEGRDVTTQLDPRFTFENFVVGKPNELAFAAARRVAESLSVAFNPLFLYGGVGLGKTHLMHAIAWHIAKTHPGRRVIYLSAEKFMYQFIRALRFRDTMSFKEQFRSVDVLMIDDVQFISGKDSTQEEFFHTFNALVDQNRQVIISADKSPSDLEGMEERLRSRLGWGLVADIHPTTYELRLGILQAKAETFPVAIPHKVLEFLAKKVSSNVRELEGALNRIAAHATFVGTEVTLETTQDLLRDLLRASDRKLSIDDIQKKVAEHYNIRIADMHSARRARQVARPRQVAMYLAKQLTNRSLPEIGRKFGGRDHTTVMHAIRKVEDLVDKDSAFAEDLNLVRRALTG
jgi:chromosomal replication initiator protein